MFNEREKTYVRVSRPSDPITGSVASVAFPAVPETRLNFALLYLSSG